MSDLSRSLLSSLISKVWTSKTSSDLTGGYRDEWSNHAKYIRKETAGTPEPLRKEEKRWFVLRPSPSLLLSLADFLYSWKKGRWDSLTSETAVIWILPFNLSLPSRSFAIPSSVSTFLLWKSWTRPASVHFPAECFCFCFCFCFRTQCSYSRVDIIHKSCLWTPEAVCFSSFVREEICRPFSRCQITLGKQQRWDQAWRTAGPKR